MAIILSSMRRPNRTLRTRTRGAICRARKNASARCGDLERPEKVVRPLIHALAAGEQVELALPVDNDDAAGRLRALLEHYLTRVAAREADCLRRRGAHASAREGLGIESGGVIEIPGILGNQLVRFRQVLVRPRQELQARV